MGLDGVYELPAAGFHYAAGFEDVYYVRLHVFQQFVVVGDDDGAFFRAAEGVHAIGHNLEGIYVQAAVCLVQDGALRLALTAAFMKAVMVTPGISIGYWKLRKRPAQARSSGVFARRSSPL